MSEKCQQATSITDGGSVSGDRKLKESTPRLARGRPQLAPVGIDDRPADRESHTHTAGLVVTTSFMIFTSNTCWRRRAGSGFGALRRLNAEEQFVE
jgi:hypothetical protein